MKFRKLLLSILSLSAVTLLSACSSTDSIDDNAHKKTNFLGIYTSEPASYAPIPHATASVSSEDLFGMELPSGNKVTWLWGLITYTDY